MRVIKQQRRQRGFALPAVLIASVVMLSVLSIAVTSVAAVRTALKSQYYEQIAKTAGEAGVAYAKACLAKNGNVPLWKDAKPLQPHTDCAGNSILAPFVQVLVVGGGGGGGNNHGGGGGGGGYIYESNVTVATGNSFSVVVGGGGGGATTTGAAGGTGADSSFVGSGTSFIARGGGGGGGRVSSTSSNQPTTKSGGIGSGGGGAGTNVSGSPMAGRSVDVTAGQGNPGGAGYSVSGSVNPGGGGGGGGGATESGGSAAGIPFAAGLSNSGAGGNGFSSDISGVLLRYGAGGSGGAGHSGATSDNVGAGGITGGGRGGVFGAEGGGTGQANTGAGGGGGAISGGRGGNGGSGVVIVRYFQSGGVTGAASGGVSIANSGAHRVFRFTSNGTFNVTSAGSGTCPTDPRCSVIATDAMRSSFSVTAPTLNEQGRAVAIPNTGYVELLRKSNGSVWRKYVQPSVQAAVVPDLCSGAATSGLGWSNAVPATIQETLPNATSAMAISYPSEKSGQALDAGQMYFRRDFPVVSQGTYTVNALTPAAQDNVEIYINGNLVTTAQGSIASGTITLSPGCHTITARLTNKTIQPRASRFTAAVFASTTATAPLVATDSSWRTSAGVPVSFASPDFYADPSIWGDVRQYGLAKDMNAAWTVDQFAPMIMPNNSGCPNDCPYNSTAYMRDSKNFQLTGPTEVTVSAMCDDDCEVYINGDRLIDSSVWARQAQRTITLPAGTYRVGVKLFNGGTFTNPGAAAVTVTERSTGMVYARSDNTWQATNFWTPGNAGNIDGYEASFLPSPDDIPRPPKIDVLLIGGGGGGGSNAGGGGGGGGALYLPGTPIGIGDYTIGIGGPGYGATSTTVRGTNGGPSSMRGGPAWFSDLTVQGGGAGASRDGGLAAEVGGSGGGGAGATVSTRVPGALPIAGVGSRGGNGTPADSGAASKGGGGGGAGSIGSDATTARSGNGGAGYISYFTGPRWVYSGGGIGGNTASNGTLGEATDGGGILGSTMIGPTGGGGHGMGGNGAPGMVVIRFPIGSMTVSASGAYSIRDDQIMGVNYRSYYFTEGGTFRVLTIQ